MTNREYMAKQLADPDWIDDGGASYDSMVDYNIACPYFVGDRRGHCRRNGLSEYTPPPLYRCRDCKLEWLEAEVDE